MNQAIQKNMKYLLLTLFSITRLYGCVDINSDAMLTENSSNSNLVMQIKNQIPLVGNDMCGFGTESMPITTMNCITNNELFYNGKDHSITYTLRNEGKWSDIDINQLLSKPTVDERYAYYIKHNHGPLTLQCNKGLENKQQNCKTVLWGNNKFRIDYLLCPNLVNQYLILTSNDWTPYLNKVFVQCAARKELLNECKSQSNILITTPKSLKVDNYFTFTSKELCLFSHVDGLNLHPKPSLARYSIFYLY